MGKCRVADLRGLRLSAAGDVVDVTTEGLRQTVEELCVLENVDDVVRGGGIRHARTGADRREVIAWNVRDGQAMRRRGRDREGEATAAPACESPPHRVHSPDIEAGGEQQIEDLRDLLVGHSAERAGDETRGAPADEHEPNVAALHTGGDLADALRGGERPRAGERVIALHDRERTVWRARVVRRHDQAADDLAERTLERGD